MKIGSVARICQLFTLDGFTLDESIIEDRVGKRHGEKLEEVMGKITEMLSAEHVK